MKLFQLNYQSNIEAEFASFNLSAKYGINKDKVKLSVYPISVTSGELFIIVCRLRTRSDLVRRRWYIIAETEGSGL